MMYVATTATNKLLQLNKRIKGIAGGTSAGKTISILQILIDKSQTDTSPKLTSIVSESMPHLKRGAMRDFISIMTEHGYFKTDRWNKSDFTYTFETGSKLEFFSADQPSKVRGPRRNRLYMNELNNLPQETFEQLEVRTDEEIWADWNPTSEFYWYTEIMPNRDVDFLKLTYKDNEGLPQTIVESIESRRGNKAWWRVYGEGELGELEGQIFKGWIPVDVVPHEARLVKRGLDFGYTNDPSGLIDVYEYNGGFILDEQLYQKGMSNKAIADFIQSLPEPHTLVIGDSSEPKSIDELRLYGVNILGANKGPGSINQGISFIQGQKISYTKRSINLAKEYRNYMWLKDKQTDQYINKAQDFMNHLLDPVRYALESYIAKERDEEDYSTTGNIDSLIY